MNDSWKKRYALLIVVAISSISAFILLFLMICFSFIPVRNMEESMLVGLSLPTILALYCFPKLCQKALLPDENNSFKKFVKKEWKAFLFLSGAVLLYGIVCKNEFESISMMCTIIVHYMIVSLGEEFTYRELILRILRERYKPWLAIIISAVMFSFVLHINEDLIVNLLVRFPLGILFGYVAVKTDSIMYSIILHTMYNLIILVL